MVFIYAYHHWNETQDLVIAIHKSEVLCHRFRCQKETTNGANISSQ